MYQLIKIWRKFMNETQKKEIASFRFSVISDLVIGLRLEKGELEGLIKQKAKSRWDIPYSTRNKISTSTIRRWINKYKDSNGNIESLFPNNRADSGNSRAIDSETGLALLGLKRKYPDMVVPQLIYEMEKRKLVASNKKLKQSTVYRFLKQNRVLKKQKNKTNRKRFEAEYPNDLWQTDVMHGPKINNQGKLKKTYLIAFIDDHSRLIPHAAFYFNETMEAFMDALKIALLTRGIPRKLYTDNGSAFRSRHLSFIAASLQFSLIHAKPYSPQGKGYEESIVMWCSAIILLKILIILTIDFT